MEGLSERTIFQTAEWLSFLAKAQHGNIVLAALEAEDKIVGYFAGLLVTRMGFKILGSPLPGWSTSYMGLNLIGIGKVPRFAAVQALIRFAFDELGCIHLEMMDRNLSGEDVKKLDLAHRFLRGFEIDLTNPEDRLFANMSAACRQCIRKAEKSGVTIHEADDMMFADDYYEQLQEVFKEQNLVPTYEVGRVRDLISYMHGTGHLLLLRARDPQGRCIATGIFPAMNTTMYFWGGASWKASQGYRPNEALHWYAMKHWKARGMTCYDMGGGGEYKRKYGGREIKVPWVRASRYPGVPFVRNVTKHFFSLRQRALGLVMRSEESAAARGNVTDQSNIILRAEEARIKDAYARRQESSRYSWFNPGQLFRVHGLERDVLAVLRASGFAQLGDKKILEVGCGQGHWLREFIKWGATPTNVKGVDLITDRVIQARELCPRDVRITCENAASLSFEEATFDCIVQFTVFTSVLDFAMKQQMASEMLRVLKVGGIVLWYDYFMNSPNKS